MIFCVKVLWVLDCNSRAACLSSGVFEVRVMALAQDVPASLLEQAMARREELTVGGIVELDVEGSLASARSICW